MLNRFCLLLLLIFGSSLSLLSQPFVHPGGLHTLADLERMRTNVLAGNHPWIDGWNALIADSQAQSSYSPAPLADMGANRQRADADAHAAYLNTIRWYISGDTAYANAATNILNRWSASVNQVPSNTGLVGLPIMSFALAGELLRAYDGWRASDFASFTNMMETYLYPACTNYVWNQPCNFAHWTSWDAPNNAAIIAMGVLCDDTNLFNEAVNRYKSGVGTGAISNAVPFLFGSIGQPEEVGRDQEHCTLGIADMGVVCQVAWNQGLDLYGFANNRLLAAVEYLAQYNLAHDVPYMAMNDCAGDNLWFISNNGHGRIDDRPVYEMFYNHYAVRQSLSAPNTKAMAQLYRPEHGSPDHFGYGTLTYTLDGAASPYPPLPLPTAPTHLTATPGISRITLNWTPAPGDLAQGYRVLRSTTSGGPYATIGSWSANTLPTYTDTSVAAGTTYYYVVCAINQTGASANSSEISAQSASTSALPAGWMQQDVGVVTSASGVQYSAAGNNSFVISGAGTGIGGKGDGGFNYVCRLATNNFTMIARLTGFSADQMGLMMRGSLATNAAEVQFFMANNARQSVFAYRNGNGANLNHYNSGDQFTYPPAWYKLVRSGNNFTAYQSQDGVNWIFVQTATVSSIPAAGYYVGLAINSGSATFDNVVFTNGAVTGAFDPPVAPELAAETVSSSVVSLSWSVVTNASGYNLKRAIASGGPYTNIATDTSMTATYDTTTEPNTTYYYVATAINGGGESANSAEAMVATSSATAPLPPATVIAAASDTAIGLTWSASVGATSYNIKRGPNGGPYTNIATGVFASFTDTNVTGGAAYHYVVSAVNAHGEGAASAQASAALLTKLAGTIIGTSGSWNNLGNTKQKVFDGDLNSYFDSPNSSGDWAGLDFGFGVSNVLGLIKYCPRANFASRMVGGVFQGANDPAFANPTTLFTIAATPSYGVLTPQTVAVTNAFRYVRYLGPNNANCNVAEVEFYGQPPLPDAPLAPSNLVATAGDAQVWLSWAASSGATGYNVKRSTASGQNFSIVASNVMNLAWTNGGLNNGTLYYFTVSAVNDGGESADSSEASARPVSFAPVTVNSEISAGELLFNWPADHTGWRLEAQTNPLTAGLGTNWFPISGTDSTNQFSVPVDAANGSVFFRLIYP